jgi:ribosomal protein S18 acetylase RimI-like enzyme
MHAAAGRTVRAAWGEAYLAPEIDRTYDRNLLWAIGDAGGLSAAALDANAERLLGGAGMAHRRLLVEPQADARMRPELVALGYEAGTHVFQVFPVGEASPPSAPASVARIVVDEASIDEVLAATEEYLKTDPDTPYGRDPRTRRHLLDHHRGYGPAGSQERRFVVRDGAAVVAWARLWVRDDEAQVEDVVVLAAYRGLGYGRAVVAAATRAALADDPTLLFIVADAEDWPKELYARLGYETAGTLGVYLRFARLPQASGPGAA